ncbi:MAG TPA: aminotransferase class IV [Bacteroidales bacterium]|nr:aminotransferase class IV [Bacteroidales bacterium]
MNSIVYLNHRYLPKDQAFISPDDRGFYFADGVYEVIKYYKGRPFCFTEHMDRLHNSLNGTRINFNRSGELPAVCDELIRINGFESVYAAVYIQITRGVAPRMHRFPENDIEPTMYLRAFLMPPFLQEIIHGIRVITRDDIRWHRCNIKSIALLPNTMLYQEAVEHGAGECFLVRNGYFTEATHSNIMVVKQGVVYTHPDSELILPGITKAVLLMICRQLGIEVNETPVKAKETDQMDECMVTGTGSEIFPVVQIDDTLVGTGHPGPITRKLQEELFRMTYWELAGERIVMSRE